MQARRKRDPKDLIVRGRCFLSVLGAAASLAAASLASAPPAAATVTIGQLSSSAVTDCSGNTDFVQPTVTSGTAYVVPYAGTITSWQHQAVAGTGQELTMKVFRKVAEPATYVAIGHDGPRALAGGTLNEFSTSIPVKPGDVLGVNVLTSGPDSGCYFLVPSTEVFLLRTPGLADGESGAFNPGNLVSGQGTRLNITAVLDPSNAFSLGTPTHNTKKGTATEFATVPNPGTLAVSGNGVNESSSSQARTAVSVSGPGTVQVPIRATGKKKRRLNSTGKIKLSPTLTFTPTGGSASSQTVKVKLKKKR
jgi:hypothetical protein